MRDPRRLGLLDVVALKRARPREGLRRGQVGTIVERLGRDVFEVEFSDDQGRAYAFLSARASDLLRLHYQPLKPATH